MIFQKDNIRYKNVISKIDEFYYEEMGERLTLFLNEVMAMGAHQNGPVFYSMNNVPTDKRVHMQFFIPVKENVHTTGDLKFHSYYSVDNMLSTRVMEDFENSMELAFSALVSYIDAADLIQTTPFFTVLDTMGKDKYITLKVGYCTK